MLVSGQASSVEDTFGSYGMKAEKLVRRLDLLGNNLNQYLNK